MGIHQEVLSGIVEEIKTYHTECGIILIGSVATGTERPESDLDLNIFLPEADTTHANPYIDDDNRWQLRVKAVIRGVRIDVAWETYDGLKTQVSGDGAANCWPCSRGKVLHDPSGVVGECLAIAKAWFAEHPGEYDRIEAAYLAAKEKQICERGHPRSHRE